MDVKDVVKIVVQVQSSCFGHKTFFFLHCGRHGCGCLNSLLFIFFFDWFVSLWAILITVKLPVIMELVEPFFLWLFLCLSKNDGILFLCPGLVRYIGPVGGKKQSYVGLHLDSPGEEQ